MGSAAGMLAEARKHLGTQENPPYSNRVLFSDWYGLVGPWCDMFVSYVGAHSDNAEPIGRFAYTPSHEAWFRSKGREVRVQSAEPGDIVFFNFIGRTSHVGIVEARRPDGIVTIEGNTNGSGSRDGGSVMRHFRSWGSGIVSMHRPAYTSTDGEELDMAAVDEIKVAIFKSGVKVLKAVADSEERILRAEWKTRRLVKDEEATEDALTKAVAAITKRLDDAEADLKADLGIPD